METITIDFETYYDQDYSLSKLSYEEYINDERFEVIGVGVARGKDNPVFLLPDTFKHWLTQINWSKAAILCHNTMFDGPILAWKYGIKPALWLDTLSMARAIHGLEVGNSLAKMAAYYGLGKKGTEVVNAKGKHRADFPPEELRAYGNYCKNDVALTYRLFHKLKEFFIGGELRLIDMHIRMFTEPRLVLDKTMLEQHYDAEIARIGALLARLNTTLEDLNSNDKFAGLLQGLGIDPPTKTSGRTKKTIWAFAKTDIGFQELCNSDNETIATLCEARLAAKSTQARTRSKRLLDISLRNEYLPVPLSYFAAHTGRSQATRGQGINMQNMKRGSALRGAIQAPPGYVLGVADLKQIEPRVLAWLAGDQRMLDILMADDPYALFGADMFGIPGMNKDTHPILRQSAKSALLGAGYGLGHISFAAQLLTGFMGADPVRYDMEFIKQLGYDGDYVFGLMQERAWVDKVMAIPHTCRPSELLVHTAAAKILIDKYRASAKPVTKLWKEANAWINYMISGTRAHYKCINIEHEAIILPNGMKLRYPGIAKNFTDDGNVEITYGKHNKKIYGSKLVENCVQALARIVMTDGMLRISKRYKIALTVHDEVVFLIPEGEAEEGIKWGGDQLIIEPSYMPGIPLAVDRSYAHRYVDAK